MKVDKIPELYASAPFRAETSTAAQQVLLVDEGWLLRRTNELLARLAETESGKYEMLSEARHLVRLKRAELVAVRAWTYWHRDSDGGRSLQMAAQAYQDFLEEDGTADLVRTEAWADILEYTQYLLCALIDERVNHPFKSEAFPSWVLATDLRIYLEYYEKTRNACHELEGHPNIAGDTFSGIACDRDAPAWILPLAYELWAESAERLLTEADRSEKGWSLYRILGNWRRLWPETQGYPDPAEQARQIDQLGFRTRAGHLCDTLIKWAEVCVKRDPSKARESLALFTEQERHELGRRVEQMWDSLNQGESCNGLLVLEILQPYREAIEEWCSDYGQAYNRWYGCSKAVLISHPTDHNTPSEDNWRRTERMSTELLAMLEKDLKEKGPGKDDLGLEDHFTIEHRLIGRVNDVTDVQLPELSSWLWFTCNHSDFIPLCFAIEIRATRFMQEVAWQCHTLIELDPWSGKVQQRAKHVLHRIETRDPDVDYLREKLCAAVSDWWIHEFGWDRAP